MYWVHSCPLIVWLVRIQPKEFLTQKFGWVALSHIFFVFCLPRQRPDFAELCKQTSISAGRTGVLPSTSEFTVTTAAVEYWSGSVSVWRVQGCVDILDGLLKVLLILRDAIVLLQDPWGCPWERKPNKMYIILNIIMAFIYIIIYIILNINHGITPEKELICSS